MQFRKWIQATEASGWSVSSVHGLKLTLQCTKQGCTSTKVLPLDNLGDIPAPCQAEHVGQYSAKVYDNYRSLVAELVRRRHSLGLSQEDIGGASGLADGHINKLEAFERTAQLPTLQLWAATVGMQIAMRPCPLPPATIRAMEQRPAPLRQTTPTQLRLTHE